MATDAQRRAELGKIHLAKKRLGLDDDTYRELIYSEMVIAYPVFF